MPARSVCQHVGSSCTFTLQTPLTRAAVCITPLYDDKLSQSCRAGGQTRQPGPVPASVLGCFPSTDSGLPAPETQWLPSTCPPGAAAHGRALGEGPARPVPLPVGPALLSRGPHSFLSAGRTLHQMRRRAGAGVAHLPAKRPGDTWCRRPEISALPPRSGECTGGEGVLLHAHRLSPSCRAGMGARAVAQWLEHQPAHRGGTGSIPTPVRVQAGGYSHAYPSQ